MTDITYLKSDGTPQVIADAMEAVGDTSLPIEDRAAVYGVLHQIQLRINRAIREAKKNGLAEDLVRDFPDGVGPVYIAWEAIDVRYPCNTSDNWQDDGVQEAMAAIRSNPETRDYIRSIPAHLEIDPIALGEAVHMGSAVARALYDEIRDKGWRTEAGRRAAIKVREPRRKAA